MDYVLDASVAATWLLPDERKPETDVLLEMVQNVQVWVPVIWPTEIANVLGQNIRRKRISHHEKSMALKFLQGLALNVDDVSLYAAWHAADHLVQEYGITHYDATYLELAVRRKIPLATLDMDLRRAAAKAKVKVLPK